MDTKIKRIGHVVLYVRDPTASAQWYSRILGMKIVTQVKEGPYAGGYFLSFGTHDHDIALFPAQPGTTKGQEFEHIGLELDCGGDLETLRRIHAFFLENDVKIAEVLDHGVSTGIYFYDPDGHMLEVFAQVVGPEDGAAMAELERNGGQALPTGL
ncbi:MULTISPECIES: VOC family protein [unclassified Azospirillum]|uniref:VOC family protein n=1 Tax=unclassified Azospirillum TaxID=2630922 RepID=UPI000B6FB9EC|nr:MULTISPECIES: VOC family protein [unclassified Azospirillum]SNS65987.1 catechol 2,3-dioxygenase [Azospirillum sp. RU38E]SNS84262.1 catechol 2,3-dioxygenase [Azospirillum sp. RU37A]